MYNKAICGHHQADKKVKYCSLSSLCHHIRYQRSFFIQWPPPVSHSSLVSVYKVSMRLCLSQIFRLEKWLPLFISKWSPWSGKISGKDEHRQLFVLLNMEMFSGLFLLTLFQIDSNWDKSGNHLSILQTGSMQSNW